MEPMRRLLCVVAVVFLGVATTSAAPEVLDVTVPGAGRYHLNMANLNWTQAHSACKSMNGYLAVPETHEQAAAIADIMSTYTITSVHIGIHDLHEERSYVTVLDQPLSTMGFQRGAPNNTGSVSDNCGRFSMGQYFMMSCSALTQSMCQLRLWDEYTQIGSLGYYKVHTAGRPWAQAWAKCREENADLLVLRSNDEHDALFAMFHDTLLMRTFHYGAHHKYANQEFYTIFDEPLNWSGFAHWLPGLPAGLYNGKAPYLAILFNEVEQRGLTGINGTTALPFICKHDLHRV